MTPNGRPPPRWRGEGSCCRGEVPPGREIICIPPLRASHSVRGFFRAGRIQRQIRSAVGGCQRIHDGVRAELENRPAHCDENTTAPGASGNWNVRDLRCLHFQRLEYFPRKIFAGRGGKLGSWPLMMAMTTSRGEESAEVTAVPAFQHCWRPRFARFAHRVSALTWASLRIVII